jgi:CRISPR-associated protein Cmr4
MLEQSMMAEKRILALLAETSVHAGMGTQLGAVDLPIQRERHTDWPTIYGTGLKGVFRDVAERTPGWDRAKINAIFGPDPEKGVGSERDRYSGAIAISDARMILFPVRTVGAAFAWLTCPLALARLKRDLCSAGLANGLPKDLERPDSDKAIVCAAYGRPKILLEEFEYDAVGSENLGKMGRWIAGNLISERPEYEFWREHVNKYLVMVSDDDFRDFVRHGTEIVTRVKLGPGKTVERGALWTEENLPSETLLYSFVSAWQPARKVENVDTAKDVDKEFASLIKHCGVIQVGGKETVGRGYMSVKLIGGYDAQD